MIINKKNLINYWPVWSLGLLSLLIVWPLFIPGYFPHHDDLQVMRIFEMRKCIADSQLPCRWVPDLGWGNGLPMFNYYSALPYYVGALLSFILGYIGSAKVLFFIPLFLGGIAMFVLAKELFGKLPAFVAGTLYLFAPFRALDTYVRGDIAESFAIAIVPLVFYFFLKLIKQTNIKNLILASISLAAFLLCHNIMTLLFGAILMAWLIFWLATYRFKNLRSVTASLLLGFGLASFFLLPAFLEKSLVNIDSLKFANLDFHYHFVNLNQLFLSRFWGYGHSVPGPDDGLSFQIGWPHWWIVVVAPILILAKKAWKDLSLFLLLILIFGLAVFMMHNKSTFIWESIELLSFVQFPWRFLALAIFATSLLSGLVIKLIPVKLALVFSLALVLITIVLNFAYFKPETFYPLTDEQKLSGQNYQIQQQAAALDYLPLTAHLPNTIASGPTVTAGQATLTNFTDRSNNWSLVANANQNATVELPIFDFPVWQVRINGSIASINHQNSLGRIALSLPPGQFLIEGQLQDTPIRTTANTLSLISVLIILVLAYQPINKKLMTFLK